MRNHQRRSKIRAKALFETGNILFVSRFMIPSFSLRPYLLPRLYLTLSSVRITLVRYLLWTQWIWLWIFISYLSTPQYHCHWHYHPISYIPPLLSTIPTHLPSNSLFYFPYPPISWIRGDIKTLGPTPNTIEPTRHQHKACIHHCTIRSFILSDVGGEFP